MFTCSSEFGPESLRLKELLKGYPELFPKCMRRNDWSITREELTRNTSICVPTSIFILLVGPSVHKYN